MLQATERILVIADAQRQFRQALATALPAARIVHVPDYFEAIAELAANPYSAVLAATEPIERRPESAVKALRDAVGDGRLVLFGHPTLEPLARKMVRFGCDDYILTPASATELAQLFATPRMPTAGAQPPADRPMPDDAPLPAAAAVLPDLALAGRMLDILLQHPGDAPAAITAELNALVGAAMRFTLRQGPSNPAPVAPDDMALLSHPVRVAGNDAALLDLLMPAESDPASARHLLARAADTLAKVMALQDRHDRLQKLAITDDLTGLHNGRYFRHFLAKILDKAKSLRFPVTLLLFDIDNFKKYNDRFGHGVGDDILKQTADLMRRCVRDHDLVARISGDEFAVVFWEKDGPRLPQSANAGVPGRPPQTPVQVFERFQRLLATEAFPGLGAQGLGSLTISGGLAVYPYDAASTDQLIAAADNALMQGAKKAGKNSIFLVGGKGD